ncbi:molybdopterin converting factor subunit 1 [Azoarcus olearius]|uniref:Molybdopterin synthase sulfur carrier subunit n=1 Tax=Azoarcus sp. (strain BH72) TaxID=418699 RepID=A1K5S5_AZOSB|nr:molybdopterin converting factor subunit 1 [Azoarcus olearius]ANQ84730.1 molybdopterin converting factor subunit [Azoarcus olearius]CAL94180.1 molybdopterin converting factor, subunit [Azoarcus olearius]
MNVKILFFASLREALGTASESYTLPAGGLTVGTLRAELALRGERWQALAPGRNVRAAVNQRMAGPEVELRPGDEVAFFPPVTGG